jgi:hypothetical protein
LSSDSLIFQPTGSSSTFAQLAGSSLKIQAGSTSRNSELTDNYLVITYGSRTAGIEINNSAWGGGVVYADYVWAKQGVVDNSDARLKRNIRYLDKTKAADFVYSLKPAEFEFAGSLSKWIHHGFLTRDIRAYGGWQLVVQNPDGFEALAQNEIIADIVATVQTLNERMKILEGNS